MPPGQGFVGYLALPEINNEVTFVDMFYFEAFTPPRMATACSESSDACAAVHKF
jgi:hypothetical protein